MTEIVFLAGLNNDSQSWQRVQRALHPRLTSRALDLPAISDLSELAKHVADQLAPGTVLVGHSFGGSVAMQVAEEYPELLDALVLLNAPHDEDTEEQLAERLSRAESISAENYEALVTGRLEMVFAPKRVADASVIEERLRAARAFGADRYRALSIALGKRKDRSGFLEETKLPVFVLAADADLVVLTESQQAWAERAGATFQTIPETGHMLYLEEPELVAAAISDWWRTTEAGRGYTSRSLPTGSLPEYEVHGEGDTTLFLMHGAYGNRGYFDDAIARWTATGLRVVAWTCPGYAVGTEVPDGYGVPLLAEYAARMILQERTQSNVLLGHSMGALIGPRVPALVDGALDGLILSAGSPGFVNRTAADKEKYLRERVTPILEGGMTVAEYSVGLLKTMMAPHSSGPLVDRVIEVVTTMKTESFLASMRAITEYNSVPSLESLQVPTLMLAGEYDPACSPAGMQRMRDLAPLGEYYEVSDAGHYAFAEKADEYHEVTKAFIDRAVNRKVIA